MLVSARARAFVSLMLSLSHSKPMYLSDLGMSQFERFKRLDALIDIYTYVQNLSKAVGRTEQQSEGDIPLCLWETISTLHTGTDP